MPVTGESHSTVSALVSWTFLLLFFCFGVGSNYMQIEIMPGKHFQQWFIINNSYLSPGVLAFQFSLLFSNLFFICYCMWPVHNKIYILSTL